jgi:hypothetical protein
VLALVDHGAFAPWSTSNQDATERGEDDGYSAFKDWVAARLLVPPSRCRQRLPGQ